jgi:hypothetical protein
MKLSHLRSLQGLCGATRRRFRGAEAPTGEPTYNLHILKACASGDPSTSARLVCGNPLVEL